MNTPLDFIRQSLKGKTIYRILFNWHVQEKCAAIQGKVVDLAGGGEASYYPYLPAGLNVLRTNRTVGKGIDTAVDLEQPLPFEDGSFDAVLLFNALYIIKNPEILLAEIKRVLKPGATLYISSPFVANEMPEPHDYRRYTAEGLECLFREAGFGNIQIERFGERFTSAAYICHLFFLISPIRMIANAVALGLDALIPARLRKNYPFPLGYFCVVRK